MCCRFSDIFFTKREDSSEARCNLFKWNPLTRHISLHFHLRCFATHIGLRWALNAAEHYFLKLPNASRPPLTLFRCWLSSSYINSESITNEENFSLSIGNGNINRIKFCSSIFFAFLFSFPSFDVLLFNHTALRSFASPQGRRILWRILLAFMQFR